jgi:hypothetical protein
VRGKTLKPHGPKLPGIPRGSAALDILENALLDVERKTGLPRYRQGNARASGRDGNDDRPRRIAALSGHGSGENLIGPEIQGFLPGFIGLTGFIGFFLHINYIAKFAY